jgi:hypothetical protein
VRSGELEIRRHVIIRRWNSRKLAMVETKEIAILRAVKHLCIQVYGCAQNDTLLTLLLILIYSLRGRRDPDCK